MADTDYEELVRRLRKLSSGFVLGEPEPGATIQSAADAIEALQAERDRLREALVKARHKLVRAGYRPLGLLAIDKALEVTDGH